MPNIVTHNYFAADVFQKCPKTITNSFQEQQPLYKLFAQGFDPFLFGLAILKKESFSNYCHNNYTDTFFLNFINILKNNNLTDNPYNLAALYGHLAHYVLDSNCHPYIFYKTGVYDKKYPKTIKYNGQHTKMEMQIDAFLYEERNNKPFKNFKIHQDLIPTGKFDKSLLNTLNNVYKQTFNLKNGGKKYQNSCHKMYLAYKYLIEDKTGFKKLIYKTFDKLTPKKYGCYEYYNAHITTIDQNIFNENHKTWLNPWTSKKSSQSFFELYNQAIIECLKIFEFTHKFLHDEITEKEYQRVLKDKSYTTGISWHKKTKIKALEF